jgi:predicted lipase
MLDQLDKMHGRDLAQAMCGAAFDAYSDDVSELPNAAYGAESVHLIQRDDTECKVWIRDELALIAFRGTEPTHLAEWIRNIQFHKVSMPRFDPRVRVHRGFLSEFEAIRNDLLTLLFVSGVSRVYLTGHSKGAAQATIAAMRLENGGYFTIEKCVVFGSPRVGNAAFAREIRRRIPLVRFENCNDVVPRIPRWWMGYVHAGRLTYIAGDGEIIDCPGSGEVTFDRLKNWRPGKTIRDHFVENYLSALTK